MACFGRLLFAIFLSVVLPLAVEAKEAAVLTVTGQVAHPNRPPFDPFTDGFFAHYDIKFDKAHAFSRQDLLRLPQVRVILHYPNWPKAMAFRGPRLRDVLAAAGAGGKTVSVQALDGYAAEFPMEAVSGDKVVLALDVDGHALGIGGRGPTWLVFPPGAMPGQDTSNDSGLVWAAFHIKVE